VSKLDYIGLILIDPRIQIDEMSYCDLLLKQQVLLVIRQVCDELKNSAQMYRLREFSDINISQLGRGATRSRCGGIFNESFTAGFLESVQ